MAKMRASGWPYTVSFLNSCVDIQLLTLERLIAVDFFNHLNMLYGTVTEFCTPEEVPSR
jgi:hypothetical protein